MCGDKEVDFNRIYQQYDSRKPFVQQFKVNRLLWQINLPFSKWRERFQIQFLVLDNTSWKYWVRKSGCMIHHRLYKKKCHGGFFVTILFAKKAYHTFRWWKKKWNLILVTINRPHFRQTKNNAIATNFCVLKRRKCPKPFGGGKHIHPVVFFF